MTTDNRVKKKLQGKAFFSEYGLTDAGTILKNWEAKKLEEGVYRITRHTGSTLDVKIGTSIPEVGDIRLDGNGNVAVGDHVVLAGENLVHGMTAKKTRRKNEYIFLRDGERAIRAIIGDEIRGMGVIGEKDDYGNLRVGGKSVPVATKIKELKLLVYQDPHDTFKSGFKCHFNMIVPGSEKNGTDGVSGVFFPPKGKGPGKFCEVDADGKTLQTAVFWPSKNREFLVGQIRSSDEARIEKALVERVKELEKEAESFGIKKEEHFDYVQAKQALDKANESWTSYRFTVTDGRESFGLQAKENSYSKSY